MLTMYGLANRLLTVTAVIIFSLDVTLARLMADDFLNLCYCQHAPFRDKDQQRIMSVHRIVCESRK